MSRCFPFPPPGRTPSRDGKEGGLNDLIKLQKEKQRKEEKQKKKERKEKTQRKEEEKEKKKERKEEKQRTEEDKEKKRQRKEKKKEKKERKKEKKAKLDANLDKSDIVKALIGQNICSDTTIESLHKKREAETEQLERSSLTEEHGHPVRMHVWSSSPGSSENSNKRKSEFSPIAKAILIRLPSKKQNEFDSLAEEQLLCTTSGRTEFPAQNFCCTLSRTDKKNETKSACNAVVTPMQRMELKYRCLLENSVPLQVQDVPLSPENLDWLFKDKNQEIRPEKRQKSGSDSISCSISSGLWPRTEYLHKIDAYVLPYTVPY